MERDMVVKKGNTNPDSKSVKNGQVAAKTTRTKGNENNNAMDKNGNVLPTENSRSKRECQDKRQGLKASVNTDTNTKDAKSLPSNGESVASHLASDGTLYELDGKRIFI